MQLEVMDGRVPCPERMEIVGVKKCWICDYNLRKNHPKYSDITKDDRGHPEPLCVGCSSPNPRGDEEKMRYRGFAHDFYGTKPEPPKPRKEPEPEKPRERKDVRHPWIKGPED